MNGYKHKTETLLQLISEICNVTIDKRMQIDKVGYVDRALILLTIEY